MKGKIAIDNSIHFLKAKADRRLVSTCYQMDNRIVFRLFASVMSCKLFRTSSSPLHSSKASIITVNTCD